MQGGLRKEAYLRDGEHFLFSVAGVRLLLRPKSIGPIKKLVCETFVACIISAMISVMEFVRRKLQGSLEMLKPLQSSASNASVTAAPSSSMSSAHLLTARNITNLENGEHIDQWEIVSFIGEGAFGCVYKVAYEVWEFHQSKKKILISSRKTSNQLPYTKLAACAYFQTGKLIPVHCLKIQVLLLFKYKMLNSSVSNFKKIQKRNSKLPNCLCHSRGGEALIRASADSIFY